MNWGHILSFCLSERCVFNKTVHCAQQNVEIMKLVRGSAKSLDVWVGPDWEGESSEYTNHLVFFFLFVCYWQVWYVCGRELIAAVMSQRSDILMELSVTTLYISRVMVVKSNFGTLGTGM